MTPYELDTIVNPQDSTQKKPIDQRKKVELGDFYEEDERDDFGCRLYDKDFDQMQAYERNQILMGIDPDDPEETQKGKTRQEIQEQQQRHLYVQSLIEDEIDLSYYYLTQDGFHAILPQLTESYFTSVKRLNLAGCALTDFSINELCMSLKQVHCQTIESLDLSSNSLTD